MTSPLPVSTALQIAENTKGPAGGERIHEIAKKAAPKERMAAPTPLRDTCKAIYVPLVNNGTWGIAALSKFSGIDFEKLTAAERRKINALPAMIYHGA